MFRPKNIITIIITQFMLLLLSSCSISSMFTGDFDSYTIGYATTEGNKIRIKSIRFDGKRAVKIGSLACCWQEARATVIINKSQLPKTVDIQWYDDSEKRVYSASTQLATDANDIARSLPDYTWISDNKKGKGVYLIIGMREQGEVVIWISNISHTNNISGRVIHVVATAQASYVKWDAPKVKKDNFKFPENIIN